MSFSPAALLLSILRLPRAPHFVVAYSGGLDSHVLLHALAQLRPQLPGVTLRAVHVEHGLHPQSAQWARHCMAVCAQLDIACEVRAVDARAPHGVSPEAAARTARYAALAEAVGGGILCTAHHQDDQAETLLLQLLRGSGPRGLAGMASVSRFGTAWLARPLLEFSRAVLHEYAVTQKLQWIDDSSNVETRFDRNYLRHEILPGLRRRWPSAGVTLARTAQHCAEAAELLDELAQTDYEAVRSPLHSAGAEDSLNAVEHIDSPPHFRGGVAPQATGWSRLEIPSHQQQPPHPCGAPLLENEEGRKHWVLSHRNHHLDGVDSPKGTLPGLGEEASLNAVEPIVSPPHFRGGVAPQATGWSRLEILSHQRQPPHPCGAPLLENEEGRKLPVLSHSPGLSVTKLLSLSPARQRNVLRFWIERAGLPLPQQRHLEHLQSDVVQAAADAVPCAQWPGAEVRRYRDILYAMAPLMWFDVSQHREWDLAAPLAISGAGTLIARGAQHTGLRRGACAGGVRIAFRHGGERIRRSGSAHHATLKNLFQQAGVPPWRRERVPLLYINGELAAVAGYWYAEEFTARGDAIAIEFQPE